MHKILICDDDLDYANIIRLRILRLPFINEKFLIDVCDDTSFNINKIYDAYILDIEMPNKSGFDIADEINHTNAGALLIFLTSHDELSFEGYEYRAFRFISKNAMDTKFENSILALAQELDKTNEYLNLVEADDEDRIIHKVYIKDIIKIVVSGNYLHFYTRCNVYKRRSTMKEFLKTFTSSYFINPSSGCLVNIRYIKKRTKNSIILNTNEEFIISKSKKYCLFK